jgi:hypothetical protein
MSGRYLGSYCRLTILKFYKSYELIFESTSTFFFEISDDVVLEPRREDSVASDCHVL